MTVWIYVDTSKQVGDVDHLKVFVSEDGVLIGIRRYLVARPKADTDGSLRYYVAERIQSAELTGESFVRDPGFDINQHAQKAFGAFQNDAESVKVNWKTRSSCTFAGSRTTAAARERFLRIAISRGSTFSQATRKS